MGSSSSEICNDRCQDQISGMLDSSLQEMHSEELGLCGFHLLPGREKCVLKKVKIQHISGQYLLS